MLEYYRREPDKLEELAELSIIDEFTLLMKRRDAASV